MGIEDAEPVEAIRKIVEITFDYDETHPYFISLVAVENVHRGRNIAKLPSIKQSSASVIRVLNAILERGAKQGVFRNGVNAIDLHLFISAFCVFRVSNRFTFGKDLRLRPVGSDGAHAAQEDLHRSRAALPRAEAQTEQSSRPGAIRARREIAARGFDAQPRVLLRAQRLELGDVGNLDRQRHLRQSSQDGRDVDAAFAEIQPLRAADADQFFALGGVGGRRIADLREVKPLARQRAQLLELGVAAIEMQRVDDDAGVGAVAPPSRPRPPHRACARRTRSRTRDRP